MTGNDGSAPPVLSVVIPAYNVEHFVGPAIESVLSQDFQDLEVIVVDDGSSDNTPQRVAEFDDARVRMISQPNGGLAAARNTGIRAARGRYIALLDGDDVWLPGYARRHVQALEEDPAIGISFSFLAYIDEQGRPTGQVLTTRLRRPSLQQLIRRNSINSHAVVRAECFRQSGPFDERLRSCEDHEMWVRILGRTSYRATLIPRVLTGYRVRQASLSMCFDQQLEGAHLAVEIFEREYGISPQQRQRSLAEAYRIASRKALSNGQVHDAARLMRVALRLCPSLPLRDLRALSTSVLTLLSVILPLRLRQVPYRGVLGLMKVVYEAVPQSTKERAAARDSFLLLLSRLLQMGSSFALSVVLLRRFGLSSVGTYTAAAVAISPLSLLCGLGLPYTLPRENLSQPQRHTLVAGSAFLLLPAVLLVVVLFGWCMARQPGEWIEIALFACGGYFFGQANVFNTLLVLERRPAWSLVPPVAGFAGILLGLLAGGSLIRFAASLLAARLFGSIWLFARVTYAPVNLRSILRSVWNGLKYAPMDFIALLSEQTGPLLMTALLSRAELGAYGLCQQCLTAADTPGWSFVQAHYPELVKSRLGVARVVRSRLLKLSVPIALLVLASSALLGRYVYKVQGFTLMMAALALCLPLRYLNNFYDQILRAAGHIRAGTWLAAAKLLLGLMIFAALISTFRMWGAIVALAVLSSAAAAIYARAASPVMKGIAE